MTTPSDDQILLVHAYMDGELDPTFVAQDGSLTTKCSAKTSLCTFSHQGSWREAEWFWGSISETTVYRVETDSAGLCELHLSGKSWRLGATAD